MAEEEVKEVDSALAAENVSLKNEIDSLKDELSLIKALLVDISRQKTSINQAEISENPTHPVSTGNKLPLFSTGNGGVPTDKQTDIQQTNFPEDKDLFSVVESLKSDIKIKFRNLTKQEFKVFSAIYILEENGEADYRLISKHLGLTESSIRDYVMKLQQKGIPVIKTKVNNKKVLLTVRQELKQFATLEALMKIREPIFR
ncbi:MAG: hypothetical protein V1886_03850 [archaeon]